MTEEEALVRAREAFALHGRVSDDHKAAARRGECDSEFGIQVALTALRTINEPLPVDRDLADLRELWAESIAYRVTRNFAPTPENLRAGDWDEQIAPLLPTFRAIIQRRIEEQAA